MTNDNTKRSANIRKAALVAVLLSALGGRLIAQEAVVTPLMTKELADPVHRHNAHAFVYVLEGSVMMQVKGGKQVTLTPGQTFYEGPSDVHVVGRNASSTKPARFLVLLLKDKGAPVLVPAQ